MKSGKSHRLFITDEAVPRTIKVQATDTPGLFENRTAYYAGSEQGGKLVGGWLRWKTPAEKVVRKSSTKPEERVKKTDRRQMNFYIDTINADRLPNGEPRHQLVNQLLADHFAQLDQST